VVLLAVRIVLKFRICHHKEVITAETIMHLSISLTVIEPLSITLIAKLVTPDQPSTSTPPHDRAGRDAMSGSNR